MALAPGVVSFVPSAPTPPPPIGTPTYINPQWLAQQQTAAKLPGASPGLTAFAAATSTGGYVAPNVAPLPGTPAASALAGLPPTLFQQGSLLVTSSAGGVAPLNPSYYATPEAAQALVNMIPGSKIVSVNPFSVPYSGPSTLMIQLPNGTLQNAGLMIAGLQQGISLDKLTQSTVNAPTVPIPSSLILAQPHQPVGATVGTTQQTAPPAPGATVAQPNRFTPTQPPDSALTISKTGTGTIPVGTSSLSLATAGPGGLQGPVPTWGTTNAGPQTPAAQPSGPTGLNTQPSTAVGSAASAGASAGTPSAVGAFFSGAGAWFQAPVQTAESLGSSFGTLFGGAGDRAVALGVLLVPILVIYLLVTRTRVLKAA